MWNLSLLLLTSLQPVKGTPQHYSGCTPPSQCLILNPVTDPSHDLSGGGTLNQPEPPAIMYINSGLRSNGGAERDRFGLALGWGNPEKQNAKLRFHISSHTATRRYFMYSVILSACFEPCAVACTKRATWYTCRIPVSMRTTCSFTILDSLRRGNAGYEFRMIINIDLFYYCMIYMPAALTSAPSMAPKTL